MSEHTLPDNSDLRTVLAERDAQYRDVLRQAADLIAEKGWIKGAYHTPGGYCALGAIIEVARQAEHRTPLIVGAERRLSEHLRRTVPGYLGITNWNDRQATGPQHVVATLRAAAGIPDTTAS